MFRLLLLYIFSAAVLQPCYSFGLLDEYQKEVTQVLKNVVTNYENRLLDINEACAGQLQLLLQNLKNSTGDDIWALQMIDASAKIPAGVLDLNLAWVGRFDECLNINSALSQVKGKYCNIAVAASNTSQSTESDLLGFQEKRSFKRLQEYTSNAEAEVTFPSLIGLCIPDQCTANDVQAVISIIPLEVTCRTKEDLEAPLDTGAIVTVTFFASVACIMALSTVYDIVRNATNEPHPVLVAFSVYTNGRKLLKVTKNSDDLSCLYGIRCLSMMWVIYGHLFMILCGPSSNLLDILEFLTETKSMVISNAVFSVDTFFVVTGMLVVYSYLKMALRGHKFNIFLYYIHRYIRLTPPIVPVILFSIYLTKYTGSGPFHPQLEESIAKPCKDHWWTVILYVQNYVNSMNGMCIGQTWYLDVDWQLYVVAPIFLLFLPKRRLIGLAIMLCGLIATILAGYFITWEYKLQSLETNLNVNLQDYITYYYNKTHVRASTWIIGGFLGYILAKIKIDGNEFHTKLPRWFIGLIWLIVLTVIPVCVFAGHDALTSSEYHPYSNAFFNSLARPAWAVCIAWIIFACSVGYGGIINSFLSWSAFQILSRFVYSIYLVHLTLMYIITYSLKEPTYFSMFNMAYYFWGASAVSFGISIFWVLAFESPIIILEKYLLGNVGKQSRKQRLTGMSRNAFDFAEPISDSPVCLGMLCCCRQLREKRRQTRAKCCTKNFKGDSESNPTILVYIRFKTVGASLRENTTTNRSLNTDR